MKKFTQFYLDQEKDIIVDLYLENETMIYQLRTPNHHTGNLIRNLAHMCHAPLHKDENGYFIMQAEVPCYYDDEGKLVYIFRLLDTKVANIYPDGRVERKASIPAISKTLMSQTKHYALDFHKSIVKTFILKQNKFHTDLHTHMNANLSADVCIALAIKHQIRYPYYYIKKLQLKCTKEQLTILEQQRKQVALQYTNLEGKQRERKIDDHTFINFADFILNNIENASYNIPRIRASLAVLKDGQAVFTNLEKVYIYRYVFTKGIPSTNTIQLQNINRIPDIDIQQALIQMLQDTNNPQYQNNTLFQDKLLWIARMYQKEAIQYVEISDTTLLKQEAYHMLQEVHAIMPTIYQETGVLIRFLASFRRIPLTIIKDHIQSNDYSSQMKILQSIMLDPYVAGSDIVGEEINDIRELEPLIFSLVKLTKKDPTFVIRIHAGENDALRNNVYNSIHCVEKALDRNQPFPHMRIGHGLYTANLTSKKGKALLKTIKERNIVLEFQITSNVRLNNLSDVSIHPLKQYLRAGILCVQGSDGGALYGTNAIDEQLTLEKVLDLTQDDIQKMCAAEQQIITFSTNAFLLKQKAFQKEIQNQSLQQYYTNQYEKAETNTIQMPAKKVYDVSFCLQKQMQTLPHKIPIIIAGGSFNTDTHSTRIQSKYCAILDNIIETLDPNKYVFVIGHSLKGYEKYIVEHASKYEIYAYVPSQITTRQCNQYEKHHLFIRPAIESNALGIYKSIAYEIFKNMSSILIAFDGNAAVLNLIQEVMHAKYPCTIFVNGNNTLLKQKANTLQGYVKLIDDSNILQDILKLKYEENK